jgi:hypothetical protein
MAAADIAERAGKLEQLGRKHDLEHAAQTFALFDGEISALLACMRGVKEQGPSQAR